MNNPDRTKLAIVGTQGLPNQYGGFETLVEYLARYLANHVEITVFCSSSVYKNRLPEIHGCKLIYLPLKANGIQSIVYDIISILKSVKKYDKLLILGVSGGIILPLLGKHRAKFILNFGGLDWQRSKWGSCAKRFLKLSESLAVKNSGTLIADNRGIQKYIRHEYKRDSVLIEYGGDQVTHEVVDSNDIKNYPFLKQKYALSVARIQSDNNVEIILEAFSEDVSMPVVFIGNWNASSYGNEMRRKYSNHYNIILLDSIFDQKQLNKIRSNCTVYIHGHSAGGTNPSLVEAMNLGLSIFCYSSGFNEYTTEYKALYFKDKVHLRELLETIDKEKLLKIANDMQLIADRRYQWRIIADKYASCLNGSISETY